MQDVRWTELEKRVWPWVALELKFLQSIVQFCASFHSGEISTSVALQSAQRITATLDQSGSAADYRLVSSILANDFPSSVAIPIM